MDQSFVIGRQIDPVQQVAAVARVGIDRIRPALCAAKSGWRRLGSGSSCSSSLAEMPEGRIRVGVDQQPMATGDFAVAGRVLRIRDRSVGGPREAFGQNGFSVM